MLAGGEASPKFPAQALPRTPSTGTVSNRKLLICKDFAACAGQDRRLGSAVENPAVTRRKLSESAKMSAQANALPRPPAGRADAKSACIRKGLAAALPRPLPAKPAKAAASVRAGNPLARVARVARRGLQVLARCQV
jgi:hypothetical protein